MSAATVTPGKVFSAGEATSLAKFNLLGTPTVVIPAGSITATELSSSVNTALAAVASAIASISTKSADFSISASTDKGKLYSITTGATNVTATLPAASGNSGFYAWLYKADAGAGLVLTSPTTSPAATSLAKQGQCILVVSDGTNYIVAARVNVSVDASGNSTYAAAGNILLIPGGTTPMLQLLGTTSAYPAWKRSGTTWVARLADDSDNASITVKDETIYGRGINGAVDLGSSMTGTVNVDWSLGNDFFGTLSGNTTLTFSNPPATGLSQTLFLLIRQAAAGAKTLTWPTAVWAGGAPTMSSTANRYDAYTVKYINGIYVANAVQNMS
jgi:hypothetical protein